MTGTPAALRADPPPAAGSGAVFAPANQLAPGKPLPFTLRQVFHRLEHDRTEQIPFTEVRTFAISSHPLRQTGTLRSGKDLGLSLAYEGAKPHTIIVDDKGLIDRQPGGHERQVTIADHPELAALTDLYLNLLRGNAEKLFEYADVYFSGTAQSWEMGLVPHDAAVAKRAGRVVISGGAHFITQLENQLPNNESRVLELGRVERNPKFTPDVIQTYFRGQN
ncbi:MAG: hypothetical protein INR65_21135 [Gluconacetobacter diazotrophicus]|nr:hypothetical protein [Gluconacetobacter diazotrophicus]